MPTSYAGFLPGPQPPTAAGLVTSEPGLLQSCGKENKDFTFFLRSPERTGKGQAAGYPTLLRSVSCRCPSPQPSALGLTSIMVKKWTEDAGQQKELSVFTGRTLN